MRLFLLLSLLFTAPAFADQLQVSAGETVLRGPAKFVEFTFIQPISHSWDIQEAILYTEPSTVEGVHEAGRFTETVRVTKTWGRVFVGLGGSLSHTDLYNGSSLNFNDEFGVRLTKHIFVIYEHISNGGFKAPNRGRDLPQIAFRIPLGE